MALLRRAKAAQHFASKLLLRSGHQGFILQQILFELSDDFFSITIFADDKRIAEYARSADVDVVPLLLAMHHQRHGYVMTTISIQVLRFALPLFSFTIYRNVLLSDDR
jgi:hypothetical protein